MAIEIKDPSFNPTSGEISVALVLPEKVSSTIVDYDLRLAIGNNKILIQSSIGNFTLGKVDAATGAVKLAFKGALGAGSKQHIAELIGLEISKIHTKFQESCIGYGLLSLEAKIQVHSTLGLGYSATHAPIPKQKLKIKPSITASIGGYKANGAPNYTVDPDSVKMVKPTMPTPMAYKEEPFQLVAEDFSPALLSSAPAVPLKDANQLYQPVVGTSMGSRYFVIAIADELKMAARVKNTSLSVRCEGDIHGKWNSALVDNGFSISDAHASIHLDAPSMLLLRRTIGALLVGLGIQPMTKFPDIQVILNKGA